MDLRLGTLSRKALQRIFKSIPVDGVPVLCYHSIDSSGSECSVSLENFSFQMRFLKGAGYRCMTVSGLYDMMTSGQAPVTRCAAITFDDGFENNFSCAFPVLKEYGLNATFYISTDYVGKKPGWLEHNSGLSHLSSYPVMSWSQISALRDAGMEIGSHSVSHPYLSALSIAQQEKEIRGSRERLEEQIKTPIRSFCYPSGDYNGLTVELARIAGYNTACTTNWGVNKNMAEPMRLKRILIADAVSGEFPFYFCRAMNIYSSIRDGISGERP